MDSKGNIYDLERLAEEEKLKATNVETGKSKEILRSKLNNMIALEENLKNKLLGMNRADRRKWFKENKK